MIMFQQMAVLFLMMAVGYLCYKKDMLNAEVSKRISSIVINVANPCMILESSFTEHQMKWNELLTTVIIVFAMYVFLLVCASLIPMLLRVEKKSRGTYAAMLVFGNIGFMGFPVLNAMYGKEGLLYGAIFQLPYDALIYTYGVMVLTSTSYICSRNNHEIIKKILNIGVIACVVAMLVYFLQIPIPNFLQDTITNLGNLTAPLSMLIIGSSLAQMRIKDLLEDKTLLIFTAVKLLILPTVWMLIVNRMIHQEILRGVCLVMMATPVGSMTAMLAQQYDGDYETASRGVALSTVLSVITMPILAVLFL